MLEEPAAALVIRAHAGDRAAEAELCRRFAGAVRTFARRRLRTADAVAEFAQDAMLVFVEGLRRGAVEDPERVGGFVLGICRNLAMDRARQKERRAALWEQYGAALAPLEADAPRDGDYRVMKLEDCLTQLSDRARTIIRLSYAEGRPHGEIASALGITEANARVLRHRTLQTLRECIDQRISWEAA